MRAEKYEHALNYVKSSSKNIFTGNDIDVTNCQHYMIAISLYKLGRLDEAILEMETLVFDKNKKYIEVSSEPYWEITHDYAHWNIDLAKREIAANNLDKAANALLAAAHFMDNLNKCHYVRWASGDLEYSSSEHADYVYELYADVLVKQGNYELALGNYLVFVENKTAAIQLKINNTKKLLSASKISNQNAVNKDGTPNIAAFESAPSFNTVVKSFTACCKSAVDPVANPRA